MLFEIFQSRDGQWRWRLWQNWSSDYKVIATASEGYNSKAECRAAVRVVKSAGNAEVREFLGWGSGGKRRMDGWLHPA